MGLKGNRGVLDRRALERRRVGLEARRHHLIATRPAIVARAAAEAREAARDFDRGAARPLAQRFVEEALGPAPAVVDVVVCGCPGCATNVPVTWELGFCGPCLNADCTHAIPADV